jgi:hypothetical protein
MCRASAFPLALNAALAPAIGPLDRVYLYPRRHPERITKHEHSGEIATPYRDLEDKPKPKSVEEAKLLADQVGGMMTADEKIKKLVRVWFDTPQCTVTFDASMRNGHWWLCGSQKTAKVLKHD